MQSEWYGRSCWCWWTSLNLSGCFPAEARAQLQPRGMLRCGHSSLALRILTVCGLPPVSGKTPPSTMPHLHACFSDRRALRDSGSAAQSTAQPLRTPTCTCHTRQHPSGGPERGKGEVKGKGQRAGKQRAVNTACRQYLQYTSGNEL